MLGQIEPLAYMHCSQQHNPNVCMAYAKSCAPSNNAPIRHPSMLSAHVLSLIMFEKAQTCH